MSEDNSNIKYNHSNAKEMQAFLAKIRTKARNKSDEALALYNHVINLQPHGLDAHERGREGVEAHVAQRLVEVDLQAAQPRQPLEQ